MHRFTVAALTLAVSSAYAEDTERLSYKAISSALRLDYAEASGHDSAQVRLVPIIKSKRPDVLPQKIVLTLRGDDHQVRIPVKPDGSFELPNDAKWQHQDTWIETNQPQGSLALSLEGHLYLGSLSAVEEKGACTLILRQLFPSGAIANNAKKNVATLFPGSRQTISLPAFEIIQLRNDNTDSPQVRLLANDSNTEVKKEANNTFTVPRTVAAPHRGGLVQLRPSMGWRWRVKPDGLPWTSWAKITSKRKEAEQ